MKEYYQQQTETLYKMNTIASANNSASASAIPSKVRMCLLTLAELKRDTHFCQTEAPEIDCDICYKRIQKNVFVCNEPCNKTFHPACLEKMVDQLEETAWEEEKEIEYRCCYCRREFDFKAYQRELFGRHLLGLKANGYNVNEAIRQLCQEDEAAIAGNEEEEHDKEYSVYVPLDTSYIKKPKAGKRALFKKPTAYQVRSRKGKKQCVGARR